MKELSIEEKAKAYDDLLVKLQEAKVDNKVCNERYCCVIDDIVPELKENEDERIRREIINYIKVSKPNYNEFKDYSSWIDWLEKQSDKDNLIKELGKYKVKYTQEVLEKHINSMSNKDGERLKKDYYCFS